MCLQITRGSCSKADADSVGLGCGQVLHFNRCPGRGPCWWPLDHFVRSKASGLRELANSHPGRWASRIASQPHIRMSTAHWLSFLLYAWSNLLNYVCSDLPTKTQLHGPLFSIQQCPESWIASSSQLLGLGPQGLLPSFLRAKGAVGSEKDLWVGLIPCFSRSPCIHQQESKLSSKGPKPLPTLQPSCHHCLPWVPQY